MRNLRWINPEAHKPVVNVEPTIKLSQDELDNNLIKAIDDNDLEKIKYSLKYGANIHVENDYPLRWACGKGHLEIVCFLVEHGANVHADNDYALRLASQNGHLDVVKYLESLP